MAASPEMIQMGMQAAGAMMGGDGPAPIQFNPMDVTGGVGTATFNDGGIQLGLSPQAQALQNQMFGGASNQFGNLSDPTQVAQNYYSQGMDLLNPGQAQERSSLESRLFAQGRLGSTGGANQFGGLMQAQNQARNQLAQQSLFRGTQQRGQEIGQGMQLFGGGMGLNQTSIQAAQLGLQGGKGNMEADSFNSLLPQSPSPMQGMLFSGANSMQGMESMGGGGGGGTGYGGNNVSGDAYMPSQQYYGG